MSAEKMGLLFAPICPHLSHWSAGTWRSSHTPPALFSLTFYSVTGVLNTDQRDCQGNFCFLKQKGK